MYWSGEEVIAEAIARRRGEVFLSPGGSII
jgi:hypothetical protein